MIIINISFHVVSTPDVLVRAPLGPLFAGRIAPLTLTCYIYISNATDTDVVIMDTDIMWFRGNPLTSDPLSNSDARVTISSVSRSEPFYISNLTLDPLSTEDNNTFTCRARARPPNVLGFITASDVVEDLEPVVISRE